MLYLTTRSKMDSYTAHRVLHSDRPQGGGFFVPLRLPFFSEEELSAFCDNTFSGTIAKVLNLFFGTAVSGWDVDLAVGRQAARLVQMSHRIFVLETWHNHDGDQRCYENRLYKLYAGNTDVMDSPGSWFLTAVDIAMLFAVYGELLKCGVTKFNVAFPSADMRKLLSVRYAQRMGLPVVTTALGAKEEEDIWELIYHGNYATKRTHIPEGLEQLIYLYLGYEGVSDYLKICQNKGILSFTSESLNIFSNGLFATVVGKNRVANVIVNVKRSCNYDISNDAACGYAALQDCRVRGSGGLDAVLFSEKKPEA